MQATEKPAASEAVIRSRKRRERTKNLVAYSFIAPNFIGFAVFTLVPMVFAIGLAFCNWDGQHAIEFVGLKTFWTWRGGGCSPMLPHPQGLALLCCPTVAQGPLPQVLQQVRDRVSSPALMPMGLDSPHPHHQSQLYCAAQARCRACSPECCSQ